MISVNLLPWREARHARRSRKLLIGAILFWLGCLGVGYLIYQQANAKLADQQNRINYLNQEIAKVDENIRELATLHNDRDELLNRINVIQRLQHNRQQVVHVFDDLVRKLPSGVTLDSLKRHGAKLNLTGRAQSNARISALMNRLDSSVWFGESDLSVVSATDEDEARLSEFELNVNEKTFKGGGHAEIYGNAVKINVAKNKLGEGR